MVKKSTSDNLALLDCASVAAKEGAHCRPRNWLRVQVLVCISGCHLVQALEASNTQCMVINEQEDMPKPLTGGLSEAAKLGVWKRLQQHLSRNVAVSTSAKTLDGIFEQVAKIVQTWSDA